MHTRRQTLLQLIRLLAIFQHQRVQEACASDFELDLVGLLVALNSASCSNGKSASILQSHPTISLLVKDLAGV